MAIAISEELYLDKRKIKISDLAPQSNVDKVNDELKIIDKRDYYSTEETVIGKYLGKPLYRKVLNLSLTGQNTRYNHGIDNLDFVIKAYGRTNRSDGLQQIIPANYTNWQIWLYDFSTTSFTLRFDNNQWNAGLSDCHITLEYTKTTD